MLHNNIMRSYRRLHWWAPAPVRYQTETRCLSQPPAHPRSLTCEPKKHTHTHIRQWATSAAVHPNIHAQLKVMFYSSVKSKPSENKHKFVCFFKKLKLLFSKDTLNWSKVTVKTFMLQKISISNKSWGFFFWTFYSSKNHERSNVSVSTKIWSSTSFNIDNNQKCFLSRKSAY